MIGPVFWLELRRLARRGRHQTLRQLVALSLAGAALLFLLQLDEDPPENQTGWLTQALHALTLLQSTLLLLAVPAFVAVSMGVEKTSGTLEHLLTTPLESRHIIAGKWLAHLVQLSVLALPAVPLLALLGGCLGLPWHGLLALALAPLAPLPALVAVSLLAAVYARTASSAVSRSCLLLVGGWLLAWLVGMHGWLRPGVVLDVGLSGQESVWRALAWTWLLWSLPLVPCLALACWRLRPAYRAQLPGEPGISGEARPRPAVDERPVRWKERHLGEKDWMPFLGHWPLSGGIALVLIVALLIQVGLLIWTQPPLTGSRSEALRFTFALFLAVPFLAALLSAVRCFACVNGERSRRTWELLLSTPLDTKRLLRDKLRGALGPATLPLLAYWLIAPPLATLLLRWDSFPWEHLPWDPIFLCLLVVGAAAVSWAMSYFAGAVGLAAAVKKGGSWWSLLGALITAYLALLFFAVYLVPIVSLFCTLLADVVFSNPRNPYSGKEVVLLTGLLTGLATLIVLLLVGAEERLEAGAAWIEREERITQARVDDERCRS